jgi:hypothetical protein
MIDDLDRTRGIGARAREWVETWHTPAVYADGLVKVIDEAGTYSVRQALATDLAKMVHRVGFTDQDEIMQIVADSATNLFAAEPRKGREILFD